MRRRSPQPAIIGLALAGLPFLLLSIPHKQAALARLVTALPFLIFAIVAFLGEKLNQRRIVFVALAFCASYAYLVSDTLTLFSGTPTMHARFRAEALAFALPLSLFFLFPMPDRWMRRSRTLLVAAILAAPLILTHQTYARNHRDILDIIDWRWIPIGSHLPTAALGLAVAFAASVWFTRDTFERDFQSFVALSLVPLFAVLHRAGIADPSRTSFDLEAALVFFSAGLLLIYATFRLYWQKVYRDELTGLLNRRALNERLLTLRKHYSLAMTDIDHFKKFNDSFGHEQGDTVLRLVAKHLSKISTASIYRYGGEEICLIFENEDSTAAAKIMEEIRESLAAREFHIRASRKMRAVTSAKERDTHRKRRPVHITFSVGVASPQKDGDRPEDVLIAADAALYKAKQLGRNRVIVALANSHSERRSSRR